MATERTTEPPTASETQPGPALLEERSIVGILVHLLGVATFVVGPGVVYLVSSTEFTRENARNAFDWQALVLTTIFGLLAVLGVTAGIDSYGPDHVATDALLVVGLIALFGAFSVLSVVFLANFAFGLVATGKAIFGSTWRYPVAPDVVGRIGRSRSVENRWHRIVAGYALGFPGTLAVVYLSGIDVYADHGVAFAAGFLAALTLSIGSPFVLAALYRDARALAATDTSWQPAWERYVAVTVVGAAGTYAVAAYYGSVYPAGDATYGFFVTLWVGTVIYSLQRYRHLDRSATGRGDDGR